MLNRLFTHPMCPLCKGNQVIIILNSIPSVCIRTMSLARWNITQGKMGTYSSRWKTATRLCGTVAEDAWIKLQSDCDRLKHCSQHLLCCLFLLHAYSLCYVSWICSACVTIYLPTFKRSKLFTYSSFQFFCTGLKYMTDETETEVDTDSSRDNRIMG